MRRMAFNEAGWLLAGARKGLNYEPPQSGTTATVTIEQKDQYGALSETASRKRWGALVS